MPPTPPAFLSHEIRQLRYGRRAWALAGASLVSLLLSASGRAGPGVVALPEFFTTATKLPTEIAVVPGMVSVVSGQELADRGARDLRGALALVGGVDIAPGGDMGPAGSAPGSTFSMRHSLRVIMSPSKPIGMLSNNSQEPKHHSAEA